MAQININKSSSFETPPSGKLGYGFDINGNPCIINPNGSTTILGTSEEVVPNIIANLGVGLEADLPATHVTGDVYVTSDTLLYYYSVDNVTWDATALVEGQYIVDSLSGAKPLYVYNGTELILLNPVVFVETYIVGTYLAADWLSLSVGGTALAPTIGKIYVVLTSGDYANNTYRWSGTAYVLIGGSGGGSVTFATQEEAEGNTDGTKSMNPLRTFQQFVSNIATYSVAALNTTSKFLVGAINEVYAALSGKANLSGADFTGNISIKGSGTNKTIFATAETGNGAGHTITFPAATGTAALTTDIVNSRLQSYSTTATATGTTTLTAASNFMQYFTGTLGQIIVMPDVTTLVLGFQFKIINNSTQALTLNSSGGNLIISLAAGSEITVTCILITGTTAASWSKLAEAVNIPASEKVVTIGTTGLQTSYDLQVQIIAVGTLASQSWVTGQATYTGLQGQWTVDANYKYDCIGTNTWIRTPVTEARYDMWLADINDSAADKTSTDLDTAYAAAIIGQWVAGTVRNIYYKHATNDWIRIPRNITTDNTYIPERLADITGVVNGYQLSIKAGCDIRSIRAVAETTTAGNITIGSTGTPEVSNLEVTAACSSNGNVDIVLNGVTFTKALTTAANTATLVATALRAFTYTGYVTGGSGVNVTFTSIYAKTETDATYSAGSTGASGTMTTTIQGVNPNADIVTSTALPIVIGTGLRLTYIEYPLFPTAANRVVYVAISSGATIKLQIVLERIY